MKGSRFGGSVGVSFSAAGAGIPGKGFGMGPCRANLRVWILARGCGSKVAISNSGVQVEAPAPLWWS